jgi:O-antigen ligase
MLEAALKSTRKRAKVSSLFLAATRSRFWLFCVDLDPLLVAASLPWSTTAVVVFMIMWFIALTPTIEPRSFLRLLKQPACFLPIAFFALAVIGTLWADGPWAERLHGIGPVAKLLAIPFLIYHFERSTRGVPVLIAFLVSCVLLLAMSWIVAFDPRLALKAVPVKDYYGVAVHGVPVKNYIDQSQEFAEKNFVGGVANCGLLELCRQHDICDRFADSGGHDPCHACCICAASSEMAKRRDNTRRDGCIRRAGMGNVTSVALEG